jgi:hypothetical protein
LETVRAALDHHKVLALLFYNHDSPDDQAVAAELKSIPTQGGAVVKLAVPLQELASYASLLSSVPVNYSPTLVLIDRQRQAQEITGFATAFEIDRRVADALGSQARDAPPEQPADPLPLVLPSASASRRRGCWR